jgi:predicted extracellular nuclease
MDKRTSRLLAAVVLAFAAAGSAQAQVVISQVYGGGGNSGARYKSDFIELHNNGASAVSLNGWSVQYQSATGTGNWTVTPLTGSIAPGGYFLIKEADGTGGTDPLPTPDVIPAPPNGSPIAMSGSTAKVALVNNSTALTGACPATRVDLVGIGPTANCSEGGDKPTPVMSNTTAAIRKNNGCTDTDVNLNDFDIAAPTPRNSASPAFACSGGNQPVLSVADVSLDEGNSGTTSFVFTLSLSQPAGAGGVAWSASTLDGTATAGSDYTAVSALTGTIAEGQSSATVAVDVSGDTVQEASETFKLRVQVVSGGLPVPPAFAEATATIVNDDVVIVPIHDIQGNGATSPLTGQIVTTEGVVTGRKSNGFFIQASDADADADPATSEGVYVFTSTAPTAAATVGNRVRVSGTVVEFIPTADLGQLPLTELSFATYSQTGTASLPVPVVLPQVLPTSPLDALERFEAMRVSIPSFTVTAPTKGSTNEPNATGTSNGIFHGVIGDLPRPFREPGIQPGTPIPGGGTSPPIPRWDGNAELMTVDSDALGAPKLEVANGAVITGMTGPLDYGFRRYTLLVDPASTVNVTPGPAPHAAVETVDPNAVSVAGYNLERFFDTANDPNTDDPVLTAAAYDQRKKKASLGIRDYLKTPDILGTVEVENLTTLQDLAARINADAVTAGQPNPNYVAYLMEGNDVGGIDVGYLVKTAEVLPGKPRVDVVSVTQIGKDTQWTDPTGSTKPLNDRPPLALDAVVHYADGRDFPISVVLVHQRSLNDVDTEDAQNSGDRVRRKRQAQAEFLATYLNQRQTDNPATRLLVLGDFNAFEFNDGYVDAMNVITGTPTPDNETVVPGDGADLVDPNLINLASISDPSERYSFVFDGNAQSLDHVLVNEEMVVSTGSIQLAHARINADYPEVNRNLADSPSRLSDHDPVVTYLVPREIADLGVTAAANAATAQVGQSYGYSVVASNHGPGRADAVGVGFALDAEVPSLSVTAPNASWTCDAPQIANGKTSVACDIAQLAANDSATFTLSATATADLAGKSVKLAVAGTTTSQDTVAGNDAAEASVAITAAGSDATPIANSEIARVSGEAGQAKVYRIDIPAGARNLRVITQGGTGDVSLYLKRGAPATTSDYDLRSIRTGNNEVVFTTNPQAGTWYITVLGGATAFSRVTLLPTFVVP